MKDAAPHFIVNPAAGGMTCIKKFEPLQRALDRQGTPYTTVFSEEPGHASALARHALASGKERVVAVGGDGTVREVAQTLVHTGVPMGIVPMGTGNDIVKALGIPEDPAEAVKAVLNGTPRQVDAAMANDKLFFNVSGFGFDVDVLQKTERYKKKFRGTMPYLLGLLHALLGLRGYHIDVSSDTGSFSGEAMLLSAGNGNYIGGGMKVTPLADVADGLLDICAVEKVGRLRVLRFLSGFVRGDHIHLDIVHYFQARDITVECAPVADIQLDGEIIERTPVRFRTLPSALTVLS